MTDKRNPLAEVVRPDERFRVFIDGANLYSTVTKGLNFDVDYKKLRAEFGRLGRFVRAGYYSALLDDVEYSPLRPLIDWLDYNGYDIVSKPAKEYTDAAGHRRLKGDMDVELAVDMLEAASTVDHIILFSGDGDFFPVVEALRRKGVRVTVVSTIKSNPPMISVSRFS